MYTYTYIHIYVYVHIYIQDQSVVGSKRPVGEISGELLHKCFELLCSLLMPFRLGLRALRRIYRQDYEPFFHVIILSKHHHHHQVRDSNQTISTKTAHHPLSTRNHNTDPPAPPTYTPPWIRQEWGLKYKYEFEDI
jgi:hypothetical protein